MLWYSGEKGKIFLSIFSFIPGCVAMIIEGEVFCHVKSVVTRALFPQISLGLCEYRFNLFLTSN